MPYRAFILVILLFVVLALSTTSPEHAIGVMTYWVHAALPLVALSLAAGIIISCGQIDIASGAAFSLLGMIVLAVMAQLGSRGTFILWSSLGAWVIVILFYVLMYVLIIVGRIPALLCTLGLAFCAKSFSLLLQSLMHGATRTVPVDGAVRVFGWSCLLISVVIGILLFWRYLSDFGLYHIAVGLDVKSAQIAGIRTNHVYLAAFLMSGVLVGLSSVLFLVGFQRGGWAPDTGWGKELLAIAAAVIGGCRITGGRFDPICVALATIMVVAVRDASTSLIKTTDYEYLLLGGGVIVVGLLDFFDRAWSTSGSKRRASPNSAARFSRSAI
jgi:ribose/xylose/arabinose/galactoside ABC-type transport system permease subunit